MNLTSSSSVTDGGQAQAPLRSQPGEGRLGAAGPFNRYDPYDCAFSFLIIFSMFLFCRAASPRRHSLDSFFHSYRFLIFIDFTLDRSFNYGYERLFIHWYWRFNRHCIDMATMLY